MIGGFLMRILHQSGYAGDFCVWISLGFTGDIFSDSVHTIPEVIA